MRNANAIELLDVRVVIKVKDYNIEPYISFYPEGEFEIVDCETLEVLGETHGVLYYRMGYQGDDKRAEFSYNGKYLVHWARGGQHA